MKKIGNTILEVVRDNLIILIIFSIFLALETFELDYSVYSPGDIISLEERLDNKIYESSGSFNLTYVSYRKGTIFNLILAKILPSHDIIKNEEITAKQEDIIASLKRDDIQLQQAISNATYISYKYANKDIKEISENDYVYYIAPEANTELKVGDKILTCDNNNVNNYEDINKCIKSHTNDQVKLKVLRNNKELTTNSVVTSEGIIGMVITRIFDYEINPNMRYHHEKNESGSSGGLMLSLSMYNSLVEEDITKGMRIAGTGTIEYDGSVGEIAGVKYKIMGASDKNVDLFIVPRANYEEAKQVIEEHHYNIKLMIADTFEQVLNDLKNYN